MLQRARDEPMLIWKIKSDKNTTTTTNWEQRNKKMEQHNHSITYYIHIEYRKKNSDRGIFFDAINKWQTTYTNPNVIHWSDIVELHRILLTRQCCYLLSMQFNQKGTIDKWFRLRSLCLLLKETRRHKEEQQSISRSRESEEQEDREAVRQETKQTIRI